MLTIEFENKEYYLRRTCFACPEQYDVFLEDAWVGYIRLRHSWFLVTCPDYNKVFLEEKVDEGQHTGIFEDEEQRQEYLEKAVKAIHENIQ